MVHICQGAHCCPHTVKRKAGDYGVICYLHTIAGLARIESRMQPARESVPGEVTVLLARIQHGDREAVSDLASLAFPELRRLAVFCLRGKGPGHTWLPTDLVNELWVRLLRRERIEYRNRGHFLGAAAHLMRALVIDHARMRGAGKRSGFGAGFRPDSFDPHLKFSEADAAELVALD